jgi:hypothetical protein
MMYIIAAVETLDGQYLRYVYISQVEVQVLTSTEIAYIRSGGVQNYLSLQELYD